MNAAAKTMKYHGVKALNHIAGHSRLRAEQMVTNVRYSATNPEYKGKDSARFLFGEYIKDELLRRYDKGIVSLAARENCPLMWSHYGDQHMGLCIGYSVPDNVAEDLHKITYGGSRLIEASAVAAMLNGDNDARCEVDKAVLTRKAMAWRYEREWRLVGPRGPHDSPLELEEIVFGLRCSYIVKFTVFCALQQRRRPVKFFEICEKRGKFLLSKRNLNTDELASALPRRARDVHDCFSSIADEA